MFSGPLELYRQSTDSSDDDGSGNGIPRREFREKDSYGPRTTWQRMGSDVRYSRIIRGDVQPFIIPSTKFPQVSVIFLFDYYISCRFIDA